MNHLALNQFLVEIIIRFVSGSPADAAHAREMMKKLSEAEIKRLKNAADTVSIAAENAFFDQRRKKRGDKLQ